MLPTNSILVSVPALLLLGAIVHSLKAVLLLRLRLLLLARVLPLVSMW